MNRSRWRVVIAQTLVNAELSAAARVPVLDDAEARLAARMDAHLARLHGRAWVYTVGAPERRGRRGPWLELRQTARIYLPRRKLNVLRDRFSY